MMLSDKDFEAKYKVNEDGTMAMQLVFKPIVGQFTPPGEMTEESAIAELKKQMSAAISNMMYGDVVGALYQMCAKVVGMPFEKELVSIIDNLKLGFDNLEAVKVEEGNGEEKSEES